jgi:hypothetical protein
VARKPENQIQEQLVLFAKRGGKRRGAGRPPKGPRAGSPHKQRPFLNPRYPVHVTLRAISAVGNLRRRNIYQAVREATLTTAHRRVIVAPLAAIVARHCPQPSASHTVVRNQFDFLGIQNVRPSVQTTILTTSVPDGAGPDRRAGACGARAPGHPP